MRVVLAICLLQLSAFASQAQSSPPLAAESMTSARNDPHAALPAAARLPQPKVAATASGLGLAPSISNSEVLFSLSVAAPITASNLAVSSPLPIQPGAAALPLGPADKTKEVKRKLWYALVAAQHGAATLDAWTTRRNIETGRFHETDPLLRPFVKSNVLYPVMQVFPGLADYVGYRMLRSSNPKLRRLWWLPQSLVTGAHLWGASSNLAIAH